MIFLLLCFRFQKAECWIDSGRNCIRHWHKIVTESNFIPMSHKQRRPNYKLLEKRSTTWRLFDSLKLNTVLANALVAKRVRKAANIQRMLTPGGSLAQPLNWHSRQISKKCFETIWNTDYRNFRQGFSLHNVTGDITNASSRTSAIPMENNGTMK